MKANLTLVAAAALFMTSCQKENIKPVSESASGKTFTEKVVVKDNTGTVSYTYEIITTDQAKLDKLKNEMQHSVLVPFTEEQQQTMTAASKSSEAADNDVTINVHVDYSAEFFNSYKQYKGKHLGFVVQPLSADKTYNAQPVWYGIGEWSTTGGVSKFVFMNQTRYLRGLSYVNDCQFFAYKNGSSSYFQTWTKTDLTGDTGYSNDGTSFPGPVNTNEFTRVKASTVYWTAPGADKGKMDLYTYIWVP